MSVGFLLSTLLHLCSERDIITSVMDVLNNITNALSCANCSHVTEVILPMRKGIIWQK